ncbi:hypothetical protein MN202_15440 [Rheinheimera muenzenbergensis]|uniref:Uncharacterized protein n=1 Tax=Rheinheimera muenzenbergensis TaxID=1193628 RepID=A0ABU8CAF9_9GAMM
MGSLFQLIFVGIGYVFLATVAGFVLLLLAKVLSLFVSRSMVPVGQFFWFPIKLGPYFLLAIIANIFVCGLIRNVDPPLTDYWSLPVAGQLTLGAIDQPDIWNLWPERNGGEVLVSDIVSMGVTDNTVYGKTKSDAYFIYSLNAAQQFSDLSEDQFNPEIIKIAGENPTLQRPSDYYYDNRDTGDLITLLLILIYPLCRFYKLCKDFHDRLMHSA